MRSFAGLTQMVDTVPFDVVYAGQAVDVQEQGVHKKVELTKTVNGLVHPVGLSDYVLSQESHNIDDSRFFFESDSDFTDILAVIKDGRRFDKLGNDTQYGITVVLARARQTLDFSPLRPNFEIDEGSIEKIAGSVKGDNFEVDK